MMVFITSIMNRWIAFSQKQIVMSSTQRLLKVFKKQTENYKTETLIFLFVIFSCNISYTQSKQLTSYHVLKSLKKDHIKMNMYFTLKTFYFFNSLENPNLSLLHYSPSLFSFAYSIEGSLCFQAVEHRLEIG